MPLSDDAKAELDAAIAIVREDRLEKFLRGRFSEPKPIDPPKPTDPPKPADPNNPPPPPPPVPPTDPPADPPKKKSGYWGELYGE